LIFDRLSKDYNEGHHHPQIKVQRIEKAENLKIFRRLNEGGGPEWALSRVFSGEIRSFQNIQVDHFLVYQAILRASKPLELRKKLQNSSETVSLHNTMIKT